MTTFQKLLTFLAKLDRRGLYYRLYHPGRLRDAIMVEIDVPGERWEVEFFEDDHIEVEVFRSDGHIGGEEELERLFRDHSE